MSLTWYAYLWRRLRGRCLVCARPLHNNPFTSYRVMHLHCQKARTR